MIIAEATNLGIIPQDLHSIVVDTYINHACHICKSHEVDVYPMYGEGIIEFKCRKCGASRGTMDYF